MTTATTAQLNTYFSGVVSIITKELGKEVEDQDLTKCICEVRNSLSRIKKSQFDSYVVGVEFL